MKHRLLGAISLCRKAGKLKMGADVVAEQAQQKLASVVLLACDLAPRSEKHAREACEKANIQVCTLPLTMEELWPVAGKKYGIFAVCDQGFSKMITGLLSEMDK